MQTSVKNTVTLQGIGLHSGRKAVIHILPAPADHGIWFSRVDVTDADNLIPATFDAVNDTLLCTRIANDAGTEVSTVEHLMAALAGCGVHNALIEVDGPEVPIMDGSSEEFVDAILKIGLQTYSAPLRAIRVLKDVSIAFDDVLVTLSPSDSFEIDFSIDFADAAIGAQSKRLQMANGAFVRELSNSRTFCRYREVSHLKSIGLALGGGLENAIVVEGAEVLNPDGFRYIDECVRHKMLDALGDLALAGSPILGKYTGARAGHRATNELLRKLFATPGAFEMVTCSPEMSRRLPGSDISLRDRQHRV